MMAGNLEWYLMDGDMKSVRRIWAIRDEYERLPWWLKYRGWDDKSWVLVGPEVDVLVPKHIKSDKAAKVWARSYIISFAKAKIVTNQMLLDKLVAIIN